MTSAIVSLIILALIAFWRIRTVNDFKKKRDSCAGGYLRHRGSADQALRLAGQNAGYRQGLYDA